MTIPTDLTEATRTANQTARRQQVADERDRCPFCDIFTRSCAGMCTCPHDQPCGSNTCPQRNADGYIRPDVPRFRTDPPDPSP